MTRPQSPIHFTDTRLDDITVTWYCQTHNKWKQVKDASASNAYAELLNDFNHATETNHGFVT